MQACALSPASSTLLDHAPAGCAGNPGPAARLFAARVDDLVRRFAQLWEQAGTHPPAWGEPVDAPRQRRNEMAADALWRRLETAARTGSADQQRTAWREELQRDADRFLDDVLGFPAPCRRLLLSEVYRRPTRDFIRAARAFDPALPADDLFQALRNVWIANSIQWLLGQAVELTSPVFAYSLLYPYTDNYLDNPSVPPADKKQMDRWLRARLEGATPASRSPREGVLNRLVELIEEAYERDEFPEVYLSLSAIRRAQERSLQQHTSAAALDPATLLRISAEKGGTSVLTDGYLVAGRLRPHEADFLFGYGVGLQLLDDLQDLPRDTESEHATLFTASVRSGSLDLQVNRLCRFLDRVFEPLHGFLPASAPPLRDLMERSCRLMIINAVALNTGCFGPEPTRWFEGRSPFRLGYWRERRTSLARAWDQSRSGDKWNARLDSALELLV